MFHAGAEVDVLGVELVMPVAMTVERDAILDAKALQSLELTVARLVVRQDQAPLVVQRLAQVVGGLTVECRAVEAAHRDASGGNLAQESLKQSGRQVAPNPNLSRVVFAHVFSPSCRGQTGIYPGVLDTLLPCRRGPAVGSPVTLVLFEQTVDAVLVMCLVRNVVGQVYQPVQQVVIARRGQIGLFLLGKVCDLQQQQSLVAEEGAIDVAEN